MRRYLILLILVPWLLFSTSCGPGDSGDENKETLSIDLDQITERGKIIALTGYNAYSYFIYRGQPMGFEYDLVTRLADELNLELEIKVVRELDKMFEMLENGEGDLIAYNLTVTKNRSKKYAFSEHHHTSRQVLVQRKPDNWRNMMRHQIERKLIRNPIDLEGKTVYVRGASAYLSRMKNLSDEIGGDINIIEASSDLTTEDLIQAVADGEIEYTIADDNVAELNKAYYSNIDVATYVSFPQRIAWAVRKSSPDLLNAINGWIHKIKKKPDYYAIYAKYFENRNSYKRRIQSEYFSNTGGGISKFDELIKKYASDLNWDWRILASLIFQESRFKTDVQSWAGASGLMQLMPSTAKMYGVTDLNNPRESLRAGVSYLNYLDRFWSEMIPDSSERVKFVLASYNIGPGHIIDARNLAQKYGADPDVWSENVEVYLLSKSKEKFYLDDVVKQGYARGRETVKYVREVLDRYELYKQFIG